MAAATGVSPAARRRRDNLQTSTMTMEDGSARATLADRMYSNPSSWTCAGTPMPVELFQAQRAKTERKLGGKVTGVPRTPGSAMGRVASCPALGPTGPAATAGATMPGTPLGRRQSFAPEDTVSERSYASFRGPVPRTQAPPCTPMSQGGRSRSTSSSRYCKCCCSCGSRSDASSAYGGGERQAGAGASVGDTAGARGGLSAPPPGATSKGNWRDEFAKMSTLPEDSEALPVSLRDEKWRPGGGDDPLQRPWNDQATGLHFVAPKPLIVGGRIRKGGNVDTPHIDACWSRLRP